ncbi:MAG: PadR family transcriptional regulator, partial [Yaniella sp.]|nr:PadR family transcriptional regulator [Yaniella sp.]
VDDVQFQIEELHDGSSAIHQSRLAQYPAGEHSKITQFKVFAYEGILQQARAEITWATQGLALLDTFEPTEH